MSEFFDSLNWVMQIYYAVAIVGGIFFLFQLVMLFLGSGLGDAGNLDVPDSIDPSAYAFKFFSLQSISGFFLMFGIFGGWTYDKTQIVVVSLIVALLAGFAMTFIIAKVMKMMLKLQSSGNLNYKSAVGQSGSVYLRIPADGEGQIQIALKGRMVYPAAVSADHTEIQTGTRIKVVSVDSDNIMVVESCEGSK